MRRLVVLLLLAGCDQTVRTHHADARSHDGNGGEGGLSSMFYRYTGTLTATTPVAFGGAPYCDYQVTMTDVALDITMHDTSELTTMTVANTMIEEIVVECGQTPQPSSAQVFEHQGGPTQVTLDGFTPSLVGRSGNQPTTAATVAVQIGNDGTGEANVRWIRTDQGPPFDWDVPSGVIALQTQSCVADVVECLGGSLEGALFTCNTDGASYRAGTACSRGCAPSGTACN